MAEPAKSFAKLQCLNAYGEIQFPTNVANAAAIASIVPMTLGKVESLYHQTNEAVTDAKEVGGYVQERATIVFKNIPSSGDNRLYRVSIPAPNKNVENGIQTLWDDNKEYIPKDGTGTGNDGDAIVAIFHTAFGLTGSSVFMSGKVTQVAHNG
jgi:hypothetical protein